MPSQSPPMPPCTVTQGLLRAPRQCQPRLQAPSPRPRSCTGGATVRTQKTATKATRLSPLANGASRERDPPRRLGLAAGDDHAAQRHRPTPANGCNGEICGSGTCGRRQRGHRGRRYHSRHPCCRHPIDGPTSRTSDRPTGEALPRRGLRHAAAALTSAASATARGRPPTPCLSPGPAQRVLPAPGMRAADLRPF